MFFVFGLSLAGCGTIGVDHAQRDIEQSADLGTDSDTAQRVTPVEPDSQTGSGDDSGFGSDTRPSTEVDSDSVSDRGTDTGRETDEPWTRDSDTDTEPQTHNDTDTGTTSDVGIDTQRETDTSNDVSTDSTVDSESGDSACSPSPEVCDGVDNDCNFAIDDTPAMTPLCSEDQVCVEGLCVPLPAQPDCTGYQFSVHACALYRTMGVTVSTPPRLFSG